MGKASRWFRGLLGLRKSECDSVRKPQKEKRRWSFVKSYREEEQRVEVEDKNHVTDNVTTTFTPERVDNKQAIAVAAATAAAAEAAIAAAQAAAVVVKLTSTNTNTNTNTGIRIRQEWAAVKIQSAFRGCLARKALRALKGLVKLQAMVRGHIERKRTAEWLRRMQSTLLRAQARASAVRARQTSYSSAKSSACHGPATPEKFESPVRSKSMKYEQSPVLKRNGSKSCVPINGNQESHLDEQSWNKIRSLTRTYSRNDEKSDRILEIDSGKPHLTSKRRSLFYSTSDVFGSDHYYSNSLTTTTKESTSGQSPSCEVQSHSPLKFKEVEESPFCTADNSPQYLSATSKDDGSKRSPFTPTRSDGSRSYLRGYDHPSYMAYTESSKAKVRSLSAPKQRPQYERSGSSNRYSLNGFDGSRFATQRTSAALHTSFTSKAYPGSGRLDKLGMPVGYRY